MIDLLALYLLGAVQPLVGAIELNKEDKAERIPLRQWSVVVFWPVYSVGFACDALVDFVWDKLGWERNAD